MPTPHKPVGLGSEQSHIKIYLANRPQLDHYPTLKHLQPMVPGEIAHIAANTSNHWRKAFNVSAKFLFDWHRAQGRQDLPSSWQQYRETALFQAHSQEALLFSPPDFSDPASIHVIAGKTYASELDLPALEWLDAQFAIHKNHRLIVCPYLDYRQLSNERIARLIDIMQSLTC